MKKLTRILILAIVMMVSGVTFAACGVKGPVDENGNIHIGTTAKVTFNSNGGSAHAEQTVNIDDNVDLPNATRLGYDFDGWFRESALTTEWLETDTVKSDMVLYAKWTPVVYTITYEGLNGKTNPNEAVTTYTIESETITFTLITADIAGYEFAWDQTQITKGSTGNKTITAQFQPITYNITYENVYGENSNPKTYTVETETITFANPTRTGYNGTWDIATIVNGSIGDKTITAQWVAKQYTVELNTQGGNGGTAQVTATFDSAMPAITAPTMTGYNFGGFFTEENGSGTQYYNSNGDSVKNWAVDTNGVTLYAYWVAGPVTLMFNGNGYDSGYAGTINSTVGATVTLPNCGFGKTYCTFTVWNTKADGSGTEYAAGADFVMPATSMAILYAQWEPAPVEFITKPLGIGTYNGFYSEAVYSQWDSRPLTYALAAGSELPEGLSLYEDDTIYRAGSIYGEITASAGEYSFAIVATCTLTGATAEAWFNITVDKAMLSAELTQSIFTYNGTEQAVKLYGWAEEEASLLFTFGGEYAMTDAGSYIATVAISDTTNYMWWDGGIAPLQLSWNIEKAAMTVAAPTLAVPDAILKYGDALPEIVTSTIGGTVSLDAEQTLSPTNSIYSWTFVPTDSNNYKTITGNMNLTVEKSDQIIADDVTLTVNIDYIANVSVELNNLGAEFEYSMDNLTWQSSRAFGNLLLDETYTFYARLKENNNQYASEPITTTKTLTPVATDIFTYTAESGSETITGLTAYGATLEDVVVPTTVNGGVVEEILYIAYNNSNVKRIYIPDTVTEMGNRIINNCPNLEEITIPFVGRSVTVLEEAWQNMFGYIFGYTTVKDYSSPTIPKEFWQLNAIYQASSGGSHFYYNIPSSLKKVTVLNGNIDGAVTGWIEDYVFRNVQVEEYVFGDNVKRISSTAFSFSYTPLITNNIKSVTLGSGVANNSNDVYNGMQRIFSNMENLEKVIVSEYNQIYSTSADNTILFNKNKTTLLLALYTVNSDVVIPEGVTQIAAGAFKRTLVTSVTLPTTLKTIGGETLEGGAFQGSQLSAINFPEGLLTIGAYAFADCNQISELNLPSTLKTIGTSAFRNINLVTELIIPNSVTSIGASAFYGWSSLEKISLPFLGISDTATGKDALFGVIFGTTEYTGSSPKIQYYSATESITYYVPTNLRNIELTGSSSIKYGALSSITVDNFVVPETVTQIETHAFYMLKVKKLFIPKSVTQIQQKAFEAASFESIVIPFVGESRTATGTNATFEFMTGTSSLGMIDIGGTIKSITVTDISVLAANAFAAGCTRLVESIYFTKGLSIVGSNAFATANTAMASSNKLTIYVKGSVNVNNTTWFGSYPRPVISGCYFASEKDPYNNPSISNTDYVTHIYFQSINVNNNIDNANVTTGTNVFSTPYRTGYTFGGWSTVYPGETPPEGQEEVIYDLNEIKNTTWSSSPVMLYAIWIEN